MSELHERRYKAEVRIRNGGIPWDVKATHGPCGLDWIMAEYPSAEWPFAATRIAALERGGHTRIDLDADTAIMLNRV